MVTPDSRVHGFIEIDAQAVAEVVQVPEEIRNNSRYFASKLAAEVVGVSEDALCRPARPDVNATLPCPHLRIR